MIKLVLLGGDKEHVLLVAGIGSGSGLGSRDHVSVWALFGSCLTHFLCPSSESYTAGSRSLKFDAYYARELGICVAYQTIDCGLNFTAHLQ